MANPISVQNRQQAIQFALIIEVISVVWTTLEAVLGGIAAIGTKSLALSAFSVDSAVELISGLIVLSRIWREAQVGEGPEAARLERLSSGVVGLCLFTLAGYISLKSGQAFAVKVASIPTELGIFVALTSSVLTPWLSIRKRRLGKLLHSHALLGDAACGFTCAYMAWVLLGGVVLEQWFGWWWVDPVAALFILYFVLHEAFESAHAAWTGEAHHHHHGSH